MVDDRDPDDGEGEAGNGSASAEPEFGSSEWLLQQLSGGRLTGSSGPDDATSADADADSDADSGTGAGPAEPEPAAPPVAAFDPQFATPEPTIELPVQSPVEPESARAPAVADETPVTPVTPPDAPATAPAGEPAEQPTAFVWNLTPGVGSDPLVSEPEDTETAGAPAVDASEGHGAHAALGGLFATDVAAAGTHTPDAVPDAPEAPSTSTSPADAPGAPPATPPAASPTPTQTPSFFEALRMPEPPTWSLIAPADEPGSDADASGDDTPSEWDVDGEPAAPTPSSWNPFAPATPTSPSAPASTPVAAASESGPAAQAGPPAPAAEPAPTTPTAQPEPTTPPVPVAEPRSVTPEAPFVLTPPVFPPAADLPATPEPPAAQPVPEPFDARTPPTPAPIVPPRTPEESIFFTRPVDAIPPTPATPPAPPPATPAAPAPAAAPPAAAAPPVASTPRANPFEPIPTPTTASTPVQPAEAAAPSAPTAPTAPADPDAKGGDTSEGHGLAALLGFFDAADDDTDDQAKPTSRSVIGDTTGIIPLPGTAAPSAPAPAGDDAGARDGLPAPFGAPPYGSGAPSADATGAATAAFGVAPVPGNDGAASLPPTPPLPTTPPVAEPATSSLVPPIATPPVVPLVAPPVLPPVDADALTEPAVVGDRASAADTPTTKLDTREIAALLSARTGDPDPDNVATRDQPAETPSEPAGAGPDAPANAPQTGAVPPLEDATLLMGALPSPATQQLDAESLADASEPVSGSRPAADSILFPELAPTAATTVIPSSSSAAGGAAQSTTALPTPAQPGGTGGGTGGASGSDGGAGAAGNARTNRLLLYVAGGLAIVLVLIGLFALGTRLPTLFAGPAAAPVASATTKPTPSRTPTPTPTPTPTVQPKPAGPQPAGVRAWNTLGGGECIQPYSTPWAETFTVVDCATPHAGQMIYTNILSADPAAAYPGADALAAQINALCTKPGILDLNAAAAYPNLQIQGTFPATAEQWKAGQRSYYCFVSRAGGEPMTSSVAGPGPTG